MLKNYLKDGNLQAIYNKLIKLNERYNLYDIGIILVNIYFLNLLYIILQCR